MELLLRKQITTEVNDVVKQNSNPSIKSLNEFLTYLLSAIRNGDSSMLVELPVFMVDVDFGKYYDIAQPESFGYGTILFAKMEIVKFSKSAKTKMADKEKEIKEIIELIKKDNSKELKSNLDNLKVELNYYNNLKSGIDTPTDFALENYYEKTSSPDRYDYINVGIYAYNSEGEEVLFSKTPMFQRVLDYFDKKYEPLTNGNAKMNFSSMYNYRYLSKNLGFDATDFLYFDPVSLSFNIVNPIIKLIMDKSSLYYSNIVKNCFIDYLKYQLDAYREFLIPDKATNSKVNITHKDIKEHMEEYMEQRCGSKLFDMELYVNYMTGYIPMFTDLNIEYTQANSGADIFKQYKIKIIEAINKTDIITNDDKVKIATQRNIIMFAYPFVKTKKEGTTTTLRGCRHVCINYLAVMNTLSVKFNRINMLEYLKKIIENINLK